MPLTQTSSCEQKAEPQSVPQRPLRQCCPHAQQVPPLVDGENRAVGQHWKLSVTLPVQHWPSERRQLPVGQSASDWQGPLGIVCDWTGRDKREAAAAVANPLINAFSNPRRLVALPIPRLSPSKTSGFTLQFLDAGSAPDTRVYSSSNHYFGRGRLIIARNELPQAVQPRRFANVHDAGVRLVQREDQESECRLGAPMLQLSALGRPGAAAGLLRFPMLVRHPSPIRCLRWLPHDVVLQWLGP